MDCFYICFSRTSLTRALFSRFNVVSFAEYARWSAAFPLQLIENRSLIGWKVVKKTTWALSWGFGEVLWVMEVSLSDHHPSHLLCPLNHFERQFSLVTLSWFRIEMETLLESYLGDGGVPPEVLQEFMLKKRHFCDHHDHEHGLCLQAHDDDDVGLQTNVFTKVLNQFWEKLL